MFFRKLNWNVVGWFRTVSMISYAIIGLGVLALLYHSFTAPGGGFQPSHALRLGLSFTGGTDVTVKYSRPTQIPDISRALATVGVTDGRINTLSKTGETANERFSVETQTDFGDDTQRIWNALGTVGTIDRTQSQIEAVGPSLGREYLIKAAEALLIAIAIQFLYIAFRFGWNYIFGLVVVIALVRDAAMMIGIYAIADKRADDAFLAAVLTVIGYSVMDTIVILDRIRENVRLMAGEPYAKIVNTSILQTMTRSFNTLATVIITLVALLAFGGASLQNFAFALLVGICSGGYHSIFYSAPLVNVLRERQMRIAKEKGRVARAEALERPRTMAEAKAQATAGLSRDEVLAARRDRRTRERSAPQRGVQPAKYKRRRPEPGAPGAPVASDAAYGESLAEEEAYETEHDAYASERDGYGEHQMDPLDAQNAGVHERDLDLGHEEIVLNFDDLEHGGPPVEHTATHKGE